MEERKTNWAKLVVASRKLGGGEIELNLARGFSKFLLRQDQCKGRHREKEMQSASLFSGVVPL